jgi:hypothetical protein
VGLSRSATDGITLAMVHAHGKIVVGGVGKMRSRSCKHLETPRACRFETSASSQICLCRTSHGVFMRSTIDKRLFSEMDGLDLCCFISICCPVS